MTEKLLQNRAPITKRRLTRRFPQFQFRDIRYERHEEFVEPRVTLSFMADGTLVEHSVVRSAGSDCTDALNALEAWALEYVQE